MMMPVRILVVAGALAASACGAAAPAGSESMPPELRLDGVRFRLYRGDALRAFGDAQTASLRRDSSVVRARQLEAILPRGPAPVRITAPAGEGSLLTHVFEAAGGIVVARGDDAARTERARYEPDPSDGEGLVQGDDPVAVTGKGYLLTGEGFTLDPAEGTIVVHGGARLVAGRREAAAR